MKSNIHDVQAIVVASGRGRRIGGPKALLCWVAGEPLAVTHVHVLEQQVGVPTVIITRRDIAQVLARGYPGLSFVISDKPDDWGPGGSIAAAVQAEDVLTRTWTLLLHVDQVPIAPDLARTLLDHRRDDVDAIRPVVNGRGGHPVLVRTALLRRFFGHDSDVTLRHLMLDEHTKRLDLPVQDPRVRQDLDTPEVFETLRGRQPSFWFDAIPGKEEETH